MESLDQVFRCVLSCYYRLLSAFSPFCTTKLFSNVFLSVLGTSHSQLPSLDFFAFHQPFSFVNLVNAVRRSKSKPISWILQPLQSKALFNLHFQSNRFHPYGTHSDATISKELANLCLSKLDRIITNVDLVFRALRAPEITLKWDILLVFFKWGAKSVRSRFVCLKRSKAGKDNLKSHNAGQFSCKQLEYDINSKGKVNWISLECGRVSA